MKNKIKVLVALNNQRFYSQCIERLHYKGFDVFECNPDAVSIEISAIHIKPHVIILDSNLIERNEAMTLIKNLRLIDKKPIIINLYSYQEQTKIDQLENIGITKSYCAPFDMNQIVNDLDVMCQKVPIDVEGAFSTINYRISEILSILNFNPCMQGYNYIKKPLFLIVTTNKKYVFSRELYPLLSKKYDKTNMAIERAIRVSIATAWKKTDENTKSLFFNCKSHKSLDKPTNSEFISELAEYIRSEFFDYWPDIEYELKRNEKLREKLNIL